MGHLRLTIGYLKATVVHIRVTLGHLKVTIGYFFLSANIRQTQLSFTPKQGQLVFTRVGFSTKKTYSSSKRTIPHKKMKNIFKEA